MGRATVARQKYNNDRTAIERWNSLRNASFSSTWRAPAGCASSDQRRGAPPPLVGRADTNGIRLHRANGNPMRDRLPFAGPPLTNCHHHDGAFAPRPFHTPLHPVPHSQPGVSLPTRKKLERKKKKKEGKKKKKDLCLSPTKIIAQPDHIYTVSPLCWSRGARLLLLRGLGKGDRRLM